MREMDKIDRLEKFLSEETSHREEGEEEQIKESSGISFVSKFSESQMKLNELKKRN
jgi:hypothetical protein